MHWVTLLVIVSTQSGRESPTLKPTRLIDEPNTITNRQQDSLRQLRCTVDVERLTEAMKPILGLPKEDTRVILLCTSLELKCNVL